MDLAPGTVAGNYVVEAPIGRGGVAAVYRVRHQALGTLHALKVLTVASEALRSRLLREGQLQARLRHPNLVPATDVVSVQGLPGLVLELVDGPPLSALLGDRPLSVEQVDGLGAGILAGVAEAHRLGLVHRDLKPGNVLIAVTDGRLVPRVTDFGLARALLPEDDRQTRTGASLGTPRYMAREQVRDPRFADTRSDVWALGVLLYELAAGRPPFDQSDQLELFKAIDEARFAPLATVRPDLPTRILEAVAAALQPDPERRPQDAGALAERWGGPRTSAPADGELREIVESLSPVSTTSEHPLPASDASPATFLPGATWAVPEPPVSLDLEPRAIAPVGDTPGPVVSRAEPVAPQPPAVVEIRTGPPWSLVALLAGFAILTLGVALVLVARQSAPAPVPVPVPVAVRVDPGAEPAEESDRIVRWRSGVGEATDLLLDAKPAEAAERAGYFVAGSGHAQPSRMIGVGLMMTGRWLGALEELERGARAADGAGDARVMLEGLVDPPVLDAWLAEHPDDLLGRVFRVWTTPTEEPEVVRAHLAAIEAAAPGRALPHLLALRVAHRQGDERGAQGARARLERVSPDNPLLRTEVVRGGLSRGAEPLEPLLDDRKAPVDAWALRVASDIAEGRIEAELDALGHAPRAADAAARFHLGRADAWFRVGQPGLAWAAFDQAVETLALYADERVAIHRILILGEGVRLAVRSNDAPRAERLLRALRGATGERVSDWFEIDAKRRLLVAEGMVAAAKGQPEVARAQLGRLADAHAPARTLRPLREIVYPTEAPLRVDPDLLP